LHRKHPIWGDYVASLMAAGPHTPKSGVDAGDHPPITPMLSATESELGGGDAWRLFEYVMRHFLGSVSPDCKYTRTKVSFAAGGEKFSVNGRAVISPGFTAVMPWLAVADESLPTFSVGETISLSEVELYQVHNQHFTQSNFLKIAHCKLVVGAPVCNLTVHFAGTDNCTRLPHRE
jgi:DNA topoisomerase-3